MMMTARERIAGLAAVLLALPRWAKRSVLVACDLFLLSLTLWLAFFVRFNAVAWWQGYWPEARGFTLLLVAAPIISVATFHLLSLYQLVTRYIGAHGTLRIVASMGLSVVVWTALGFMLGNPGMPRTVILLYGLLGAAAIIASRQIASFVLRLGPRIEAVSARPVIIWGATAPGIALAEALRRAGGYRTIGFIDDTASLVGQSIAGTKVYRPAKLERLIAHHEVHDVFLALPTERRQERHDIIRLLGDFPVRVKTLPPVEDIASGRVALACAPSPSRTCSGARQCRRCPSFCTATPAGAPCS